MYSDQFVFKCVAISFKHRAAWSDHLENYILGCLVESHRELYP